VNFVSSRASRWNTKTIGLQPPVASSIPVRHRLWLSLSLGHRGALLASRGLRLRAPALPVKIASTVGAGDSFLAAMVWRRASGATLEDAFRHGAAAGTAALLAPGTSLAQKSTIEELARLVELRSL